MASPRRKRRPPKDLYRTEILPSELRTISEVLRSESIERVDLLKIDLEKAELDVLAGIEEADCPRSAKWERRCTCNGVCERTWVRGSRAPRLRGTVDPDPTITGTPIHMLYARR